MAVSGQVARRRIGRSRPAGMTRAAVMEVVRRAGELAVDSGRAHPLAPAALRIERSHLRQEGANADQTALTVWFGTGPNLPGPTLQGSTIRFAARAAAAVVGAAALGAMAVIASQRESARMTPKRISTRDGGGAAALLR